MYGINLTTMHGCGGVRQVRQRRKKISKENNDKIQKPSEALMRAAHTINCISEKHMLTLTPHTHTTCRSVQHKRRMRQRHTIFVQKFPSSSHKSSAAKLHNMELSDEMRTHAQIEIMNARTCHFRWHLSCAARTSRVRVRVWPIQVNKTIT